MIYGIFTGHLNFAKEIVKTCEHIMGIQKYFSCLSNNKMNSIKIKQNITNILKKNKGSTFFIFVDFFGSSFSIPSIELKSEIEENIFIIFGYNIPIVLDFFLHRNKKTPNQLYKKLIDVGHQSIK